MRSGLPGGKLKKIGTILDRVRRNFKKINFNFKLTLNNSGIHVFVTTISRQPPTVYQYLAGKSMYRICACAQLLCHCRQTAGM
jgi:hypothetical protein